MPRMVLASAHEHRVAGLMAVRVVHSLEVIDVEERERHVDLVAPRVGQLRTQLRVEVLAVVRAGQRVGHARVVQLLEQRFLALVRDRVAEDRGGAELNHVTVAQQLARHALTLHERAVGRLRVFDQVGGRSLGRCARACGSRRRHPATARSLGCGRCETARAASATRDRAQRPCTRTRGVDPSIACAERCAAPTS